MEKLLPAIPAKRYFTIGEVSDLCGVKPYVLRYWEQEFTQLKPMKRRGNRRYYQHHEVLLIRRIRDLLYDQGFTISGARNQLGELSSAARVAALDDGLDLDADSLLSTALRLDDVDLVAADRPADGPQTLTSEDEPLRPRPVPGSPLQSGQLRAELLSIRDLLTV